MKQKHHLAYVGALGLLLVTAACGNIEDDTKCATLLGGGRYCLQPSTAVTPFVAHQKIEIRSRNTIETMIAELEIDATGIRIVGLTPFGHTLLNVNYDNRNASAVRVTDARLRPALLVGLVQLALWSAADLRAGLGAPLWLEENPSQRRIMNRNEPSLTISYTGDHPPYDRIRMNIHGTGIELDISTIREDVPNPLELE